MEHELVRFVGTGLQLLAGGLGLPVRGGAPLRGYELVEHLARFGDSGLDHLVVGAIRTIWRDWRRSRLPRRVAEEHITWLAEILAAYPPDPDAIMSAFATAGVSPARGLAGRKGQQEPTSPAARRIATLIVEAADAEGAFAARGLSPQIAFFFIERLFTHLLAERQVLRNLKVPVAVFLAAGERASEHPPTVARSVTHGDMPIEEPDHLAA